MHKQGTPQTMQHAPHYADVVRDVADFLAGRVKAVQQAGIAIARVCIDPGFGFGKTLEHNLRLLHHLDQMDVLKLPLLVGLSRKSVLGAVTGREPKERLAAGIAAHVLAMVKGARILRVHDVAATRDAVAIYNAVEVADG
jgi:dihydropteroate synthase